MAQVKPGVVIDEPQSKVLQPAGAAYNVSTEIRPSGEEHDGFKFPVEARQGYRVGVCLEVPCSGGNLLVLTTLHLDTSCSA
jgi:hypothetical protein